MILSETSVGELDPKRLNQFFPSSDGPVPIGQDLAPTLQLFQNSHDRRAAHVKACLLNVSVAKRVAQPGDNVYHQLALGTTASRNRTGTAGELSVR